MHPGNPRLSLAALFVTALAGVPGFAGSLEREVDIFNEVSAKSPDGRWSVSSVRGLKFEDEYARLYLEGPGFGRKVLLKYFRSGKVIWGPDSRTLVFLDYHSVEETAIRAFLLDATGVREVEHIDRLIRNVVQEELKASELIFYYVDVITMKPGSRLTVRAHPHFLLPGTDHPSHVMRFVFDVALAIPKVTLTSKASQ